MTLKNHQREVFAALVWDNKNGPGWWWNTNPRPDPIT